MGSPLSQSDLLAPAPCEARKAGCLSPRTDRSFRVPLETLAGPNSQEFRREVATHTKPTCSGKSLARRLPASPSAQNQPKRVRLTPPRALVPESAPVDAPAFPFGAPVAGCETLRLVHPKQRRLCCIIMLLRTLAAWLCFSVILLVCGHALSWHLRYICIASQHFPDHGAHGFLPHGVFLSQFEGFIERSTGNVFSRHTRS